MALLGAMGFFSGLPLALSGSTLQAWLTEAHVDLKTIGVFSLVGLPYTAKLVWAPAVDRFPLSSLGRRRSWITVCQLVLVGTLFAFGFFDPSGKLVLISLLTLLLTFASATQDIAIDAYRREVLRIEELGLGASVATLGYRLGMIASGAGALFMADHLSWPATFRVLSGLMFAGIIVTLIASEPIVNEPKREPILAPFTELLSRPFMFEILGFILLYKLGDLVATALNVPFFLELGFSKSEVAFVQKTMGLIATIVGGIVGGFIMRKWRLKRALVVFGILQGTACLGYALLVIIGQNLLAFTILVTIEQFCFGLGTAAFLAFLMAVCDERFSGTQYAALTSLLAVARVFSGPPSGIIAERYGWLSLFVTSALLSLPGIALVSFRFDRWRDSLRFS